MNGSAEGSTPKRARCHRTRSDGLGGVLTALASRKSKLMAINGRSGHSSPSPRSQLGAGTSFSPQSGVKDGSAKHLKAGSFMGCDPWGPPFKRRATEQLAQAVAADLAPIQRRLAAIEQITDPEIRRTRSPRGPWNGSMEPRWRPIWWPPGAARSVWGYRASPPIPKIDFNVRLGAGLRAASGSGRHGAGDRSGPPRGCAGAREGFVPGLAVVHPPKQTSARR